MQSTQSPTLMPLPFASAGGRNTIPEASQLPGSPGAASYTDGFPPATRTLVAAGGIPPSGLDMNGILYAITQSTRWAHAGGRYTWNSAFTNDANVAGYPNGATLMRADLTGFWINTADNNTTNPDATDGSAANWVPGYNYGVTPITGLTNANVTLTPAQAAKNKITLAGTLTGNVQIIFPAWTKEWTVVNNTTGAFTVTAKTASGTGIALAAGQQKITGDGTNITQPAESIAPGTAPQHAVQLAQLTGVPGPSPRAKMSVTASSASATFTDDEITVVSALGGLRYCVANVSDTVNLAGANGIGAMDTGAAPTSGYVALYKMLNPSTGASGTMAQAISGSTPPTTTYTGGHAPAGYMASVLIGIWGTDATGKFRIGIQRGRLVSFPYVQALLGGTATTWTSVSLVACVPPGAKYWSGNATAALPTGAAANGIFIAGDSNGTGLQTAISPVGSSANQSGGGIGRIPIITEQTAYYENTVSGASSNITVSSYEF